ncbi:MAG: transglutaminase domain-containing protein [Planctomycetes bacterium]|nr:transglutaminase domain-containing protein [Planctomycetota bacterium]
MRRTDATRILAALILLASGIRASSALDDALARVPAAQRDGMAFLIANMPAPDRTALDAEFLLENVEYAYRAMAEVPWGKRIPEAVFLNHILPYASVNERRDRWRKDFHDRFLPLVRDCDSPARAAARLNAQVFPLLKVRYSTKRPKADQSPYESIEAGLASCTGLSVILIDACRAVGVPARFVGTPLWSDGSGNHSWVEIWDGEWHFTGAAEPTGEYLDRGWFVDRAAAARSDIARNAIYAVSFEWTPLRFPIIWRRGIDYVRAVNVTDRYAPSEERAFARTEEGKRLVDLLARIFAAPPEARGAIEIPEETDRLLASRPRIVRTLAWEAYRTGSARKRLEEDARASRVSSGGGTFPYDIRMVGARPARGWPLVIAVDGGGGEEPKEAGGCIGVTLRAPDAFGEGSDEKAAVALVDALLRQLRIFHPIDADKVFARGDAKGRWGAHRIEALLPDRFAAICDGAAAYADLCAAVRDPVPRHIIRAAGVSARDLFWLHTPEPAEGDIDAVCEDNEIRVSSKGAGRIDLLLDERLIDPGRPVAIIEANGRRREVGARPSIRTLCETIEARGDPSFAFATRIPLATGR